MERYATLDINLEAVELKAISAKCEHNLLIAMLADPLARRARIARAYGNSVTESVDPFRQTFALTT